MGAKKKAAGTAAGAYGAAKAAKENPYVQRIVEDDDLRDNVVQAYESARSAINRFSNGKSPTKSIFDDKKFQKDVRDAAEALRDASVSLREAPGKRKSGGGGGFFRKILLVTVAGGAALALSEGLRKKVLDALFGAEEEFEYTSTTTSTTGGAGGGATTPSTPTASA
jgi:hypothetical protein